MWRLRFSTVKLKKSSSNPRCLTPCIAWNKWVVRLDDGSLARIGSLGVMWLWRQWWVCLIHPERWTKHLTKLDKVAHDNHVSLLRDPRTRDFVRKLPGDDRLIKEFQVSEAMAKMYAEADAKAVGVAAYSSDPDAPVANFSSKKVFDCLDREILPYHFVRVDGKVIVQVTEDGTGDLVFSPYDKEDLVRNYWMNSLEIVVPVNRDRSCVCNAATPCPFGKTGSENRCYVLDVAHAGYSIVNESEIKK